MKEFHVSVDLYEIIEAPDEKSARSLFRLHHMDELRNIRDRNIQCSEIDHELNEMERIDEKDDKEEH
jgi:hypothetical protein